MMHMHEHLGERFYLRKADHPPAGAPFTRHHDWAFMTRRFLRPAILLLLAEEPSHGYALLDKLADMGVADKKMPLPMVYRVLRHLEKEGMAVSDQVEQEGRGPARKVYRLTDEGYWTLSYIAERMKGIFELLSEFQRRYEALELEDEG
ncbi:MAG: PadR family transcriptional regulator [Actinomycetota bacterium]|nr:PadR family transcriptional regulator [Actinomycetota bacterium]